MLMQHAAAQAPVAAFTSDKQSGCAPLRVSFRDQSTGDPKYWSWDFGNGEFSNLQNPSVNFAPGTWTVTLTVRNGSGANAVTKTDYITVNTSPTANFTQAAAPNNIFCTPGTVQFRDLSTPSPGSTISQWHWDFGDGTTSDQPNPPKTYTDPGFYTVSLKVTSSTGCEASRGAARYIRIVSGITPGFTFSDPGTCRPPFKVTFNNQTSGPGKLTYQWDLGNGVTSTDINPATTYTTAGNYTITLIVKSEYGCETRMQKTISLTGVATNYNAPAAACLNTPVTFTNASAQTPVSTFWNFGDGSTADGTDATHAFTAPGTYQVKMINQYAVCKDSITKSISVNAEPVVNFSAPVTGACKPNLTVNFADASPGATDWQWDFGDGTTGTGKNPVHTYTTQGDFDVSLKVTTAGGCTGTLTKPTYIRIRQPIPHITNIPAGGCLDPDFVFTAMPSVFAVDGVHDYNWDFGNGVTRTGRNPGPVTYTTAGVFPVTLSVITNGGCSGTVTYADGVKTGHKPTVTFTSSTTSVCGRSFVKFTNTSVNTEQWLWDFGDGTTSTDENPSHSFPATGTYNVTLTAYHNLCAATSAPLAIVVKPPIADFDSKVDCINTGTVQFTDLSETTPSPAPEYTWDFGDPSVPPQPNVKNPVVKYPGPGSYDVKLTVKNGVCSSAKTKTIHIYKETAEIEIDQTTVCLNETVTLRAKVSNPDNIRFYHWQINGGAFVNGAAVITYTSPIARTNTAKLKVFDKNSCPIDATAGVSWTVSGPKAFFTPASYEVCKNKPVTFRDQSTSPTPITKYHFDFGDGKSADFTAAPFTHAFADTGLFIVKMTVFTGNCSNSYTLTRAIHVGSPTPGFKADYTTACPKSDIQFTDTASGTGLRYKWEFGDGSTNTQQNPKYAYQGTDANYTVKQVVTDALGCADSVIRNNYITIRKPKPAFDVADTTTICPPLRTSFVFKGQDYESFVWDFGDGNTSTLDNTDHFYNQFGTYTAKLYLNGPGTCVDSASAIIRLVNPNTATDIAFTAATACDELTVDFNITTPDYTKFTFVFGDGVTDNTQSKTLRHTYNTPNNYRPAVVLTDAQQCQVTVGAKNTIRILGAEVIFGMDKKKFCDNGQVFFTDYTRPRQDPIKSKVWDFDDGTPPSTETHPTHTFTQPGKYLVKLTAFTDGNCKSEMVDTVRVYRTPSPVINSDASVCAGNQLNLKAGLAVADTFTIWKWDPGASSADNIDVRYNQPGTYNVKLEATNMLGCKGNTSKDITATPPPGIQPGSNQIIPIGGSIALPMTYTGNIVTYNWTPAAGLSCTDCATPTASPKTDTKYTVRVTDDAGCSNTADIAVSVQCNDKNYFIPNTFSPNNDGHNDVFYPRGSFISRISSMKIFNRWGEQIFERRNFDANDPKAGWDGTIKGKPANPDVYIYLIEFICENSAIVPFRGNITLLR
ncbi:PKD domain-containing protein [Pseudoflavitalea sp. G-6-1-2]|uniref:PKD domain-containing protein n=1 Tax=Pseudoflavitalea sp. G-6-1-2 TaxID=2728841 RepID=UPI00146BE610|nr:PKD domain-containing protein [Pseudoflavitalea sp. G-6-1-2]NML20648.1 PKD domain-containing protein [Pseudoflavitalea sp. G-6-1-2]